MSAVRPVVQPVILGGDLGVYALARAFHEEYGVRSVVVSSVLTGAVGHSRIIENVLLGAGVTPEQMVDRLCDLGAELAARRPGVPLVLLANTDWLVRLVVQHRDRLEEHFVVPFLAEDLMNRLADKASFAELCTDLGIPVPRTIVQDFSTAADGAWAPQPVDLTFPVIAKAASSAEYEDITFPGKQKVFEIARPEQLDALYASLIEAGFRGRFLVQELIPGDDTQVRSITAYVDRNGAVTLLASAHVLLEEHTPSGLGNPAAMITYRDDEMLAEARRLLEQTGYVGFANFDVKVDPRDGSFRFFEVNPRIGRNNFYVTAAGVNVARVLVDDVVHGQGREPVVVEQEILYSILPHRLLLRYVLDPALRRRVQGLIRTGRVVHPLKYRADRTWRRWLYIRTAMVNQIRKFRRYYPEVTGTGF